jgi:uncharacterized repeat protein (TIGR02543 family)
MVRRSRHRFKTILSLLLLSLLVWISPLAPFIASMINLSADQSLYTNRIYAWTSGMPAAATADLDVIDISQWNDNINYSSDNVDFARLKAQLDAVYFRAAGYSSGGIYKDAQLANYSAKAKAAGLPFGYYIYLVPQANPAVSVNQARYFYNLIKPYAYSCVPVIDIEETHGLSRSQITASVAAFAAEFRRLSGLDPMIYTFTSFANNYLSSSLGKYRLWIANWYVSAPARMSIWSYWDMWQYTDKSTISGVSTHVDRNRATSNIFLKKVTFNSQGGSAVASKKATYNATIPAPPAPTRNGYRFGGWYRDAACTSAWSFATNRVRTSLSLYAKWIANPYQVNFNPEDGALVTAAQVKRYASPYGLAADGTTEPLPKPSRTGYSFSGWWTAPDPTGSQTTISSFVKTSAQMTVQSAIQVTDSTKVTTAANHALYARWAPREYLLTFDAGGGIVPVATQTKRFENVYGLAADGTTPENLPIPVRSDYSFAGWWTTQDQAGQHITNTSLVTIPSAHTLYARWTAPGTWLVAFNPGAGKTVTTNLVKKLNAPYGLGEDGVATEPMPVPTRSGYTFAGWWTSELGSGSLVNDQTMMTTDSHHTLYARWLKSAITGFAAKSTGYDRVRLVWTASPGAAGYEVYRAESSTGTYELISSPEAATTTYTDSELVTGKTYYYMIRAYAAADTSRIYGNYSAVVSARPIPLAPAKIAASSAGYNSIKLAWESVTGASRYEIYRASSQTGTYYRISSPVASTVNYLNAGLTTGKNYYYMVRAYHLEDATPVNGAFSAVKTAKPIPTAPTSFSAVRYNVTSIRTSWRAVSGASGYKVYRATAASGTYSLVKTTTSTSWINSNLVKGKYYYYKIRAFRTMGSTLVYGVLTTARYAKPY